jgi:hypothetical protein
MHGQTGAQGAASLLGMKDLLERNDRAGVVKSWREKTNCVAGKTFDGWRSAAR